MLCQDCGKREAQVHLTQIVNNEKTSLSLCKECAAKRGFHSPLESQAFPLAEILSGLAQDLPAVKSAADGPDVTCPTCGLTFEMFTRQGRFGCGDCYDAFRSRLELIMRKIHGASLHRGRSPEGPEYEAGPDDELSVREEERLETELKKAIDSEDFERAAEIRDKLKTLRKALSVNRD